MWKGQGSGFVHGLMIIILSGGHALKCDAQSGWAVHIWLWYSWSMYQFNTVTWPDYTHVHVCGSGVSFQQAQRPLSVWEWHTTSRIKCTSPDRSQEDKRMQQSIWWFYTALDTGNHIAFKYLWHSSLLFISELSCGQQHFCVTLDLWCSDLFTHGLIVV